MDSLSDEGHKLRNDVKNLVEHDTLKWIFVGGKGGVGKTTISCSLASLLSERRESVLLISTDPAHSLSDAFGQKFADCPRLVNGYNNLYAMEVDSSRLHDVGFSASETKTLLDNVPDLFQMLPGIDEALSFAELIQSVQSMKYSVIIFDTAPTGHTLKFLKLPDVLDKVVENILKVESIFGMFMRVFSMINTQLSQDEMFDKINSLKQVVKLTLDQMKNPNLTTFICVCIPEFLSVFETERLIQHLAKNDIDCSYVIINQIIKHIDIQYTMDKAKACLDIVSDDVKNILEEFFQSVKERDNLHNGMASIQRRYISDLRDLYENYFNIVAIPRFEEEVRGHESIKKFSKVLLEHCPIPE